MVLGEKLSQVTQLDSKNSLNHKPGLYHKYLTQLTGKKNEKRL